MELERQEAPRERSRRQKVTERVRERGRERERVRQRKSNKICDGGGVSVFAVCCDLASHSCAGSVYPYFIALLGRIPSSPGLRCARFPIKGASAVKGLWRKVLFWCKALFVSNLSGVKGFCLWCTSVSGAKGLRCKKLLVQKSAVVKAFDIKLSGSKAAWRKVCQLSDIGMLDTKNIKKPTREITKMRWSAALRQWSACAHILPPRCAAHLGGCKLTKEVDPSSTGVSFKSTSQFQLKPSCH